MASAPHLLLGSVPPHRPGLSLARKRSLDLDRAASPCAGFATRPKCSSGVLSSPLGRRLWHARVHPWLLAVPTRSARIAPYLRAGCSRRYRRAAQLLAGARPRLFTIGAPGEPLRQFVQVFRVSGCY
ncbi:hypothetical protein NDU88_001433 [Pleurodeles waltl]|uniref:Uncharacterized protein n=1 Tax=Pleurodeles waltl TaxID=8319 RepID=A0AAV7WIB3_PLEWA|nr:hypothetical protein NDU88_001433 [Pleurodeles waltl]